MILEESYYKASVSETKTNLNNGNNEIGNNINNNLEIIKTRSNSTETTYQTGQPKRFFERLKLYIRKFRVRLKKIVKHDYFFWLVIFMVAINTIIMATKHYQQPDWLADVQSKMICKGAYQTFSIIIISLSFLSN